MPSIADQLADLLGRATEADLAALDAQVADAAARLARLTAARDALAAALGKGPAPSGDGAPDTDPPPELPPGAFDAVAAYLSARGPDTITRIAARTRLDKGTVHSVLYRARDKTFRSPGSVAGKKGGRPALLWELIRDDNATGRPASTGADGPPDSAARPGV